MIEKLYEVISGVYKNMNQTFDYPLDKISMDSKIKELGIDSLGFIMIMLAIEDYFKITIPSDGITSYETVGDIVSIIEKAM